MKQRIESKTSNGVTFSIRPGKDLTSPLIVTVPGNGLCKECFDEYIDYVPEVWALQINLTGHGQSRKPNQDVEEWEKDNYFYRFGLDILNVLDSFHHNFPQVKPTSTSACSHSMGGKASLWAEILRPGVFSQLLLIEPIMFPPSMLATETFEQRKKSHPMYQMTIKRKRAFPNYEVAVHSYQGRSIFKQWTKKSLDNYVRGGFIQQSDQVVLCCNPEWEGHGFISYDEYLWDLCKEKVKTPCCVIVGEFSTNLDRVFSSNAASSSRSTTGGNTMEFYRRLVQNFNWELFVMPNSTHSLPMEVPKALGDFVAKKVLSKVRNDDSLSRLNSAL